MPRVHHSDRRSQQGPASTCLLPSTFLCIALPHHQFQNGQSLAPLPNEPPIHQPCTAPPASHHPRHKLRSPPSKQLSPAIPRYPARQKMISRNTPGLSTRFGHCGVESPLVNDSVDEQNNSFTSITSSSINRRLKSIPERHAYCTEEWFGAITHSTPSTTIELTTTVYEDGWVSSSTTHELQSLLSFTMLIYFPASAIVLLFAWVHDGVHSSLYWHCRAVGDKEDTLQVSYICIH
jgi:hypothetical protein